MSIKLNVNDIVEVKLNDYGIKILQDELDNFNKKHPQFKHKRFEIKKANENGFHRFPLWEFMNTFGSAMYLANAVPFDEFYLDDNG